MVNILPKSPQAKKKPLPPPPPPPPPRNLHIQQRDYNFEEGKAVLLEPKREKKKLDIKIFVIQEVQNSLFK